MAAIFGVTLEDWSYIATTIGVVVAVATYVSSVRAQTRQRSVDNALRYLDYHATVFGAESYCRANVKEMEAGTFKRDLQNHAMEAKFNEFLSACEHLALLQRAKAIPKSLNAYMIGWFAKKIYPELTDREKAEPYWELAIDFLRETKLEAERLDAMPKSERISYFQRNHFA